MEGQEFLRISREMLDIFNKGTDLCLEIQTELNDDYRSGRISYEEWKEKTDENEKKKSFFREQFDEFWEKAERLKKV